LTIYAYDSFVSEWGPGPQVVPLFEKATGIKVNLISAGDSGQLVSRIIMEKDNPQADLAIGIDNNQLYHVKASGVLESYRSPEAASVPPELIFDHDFMVTPYDYGYFAINVDSEALTVPPRSLEDLTRPEFKDTLILMDPRTSGPGLGFLFWTVAAYGTEYQDYWKRLRPSILTVTDGWDSAYALYTSGEAPLVLSYTTSPPYHVEYEETTRYQALIFEGGNYRHIEGMGILKGAKNLQEAKEFIDFMLTPTFQEALPLTNFMYPVNPQAVRPPSFEYAPEPAQKIELAPEFIQANREALIQGWLEVMGS
jgi:thiamine transport system substrate-binding protein